MNRLGVWRQEMENTRQNICADVEASREASVARLERFDQRLDAIDHMISLTADFRAVASRRQSRIDRRLERLEQSCED